MKNILLLILLLSCLSVPALADEGPGAFDAFPQLDPRNIHLGSVSAAVIDVESGEPLYLKNSNTPRPIASITKLMTAMVVLDAKQPLDELLTVTREDRDRLKHTYSRVRFGSRLSRREMLLLALMSSENRAASALGRHYPGGLPGFVAAMNDKAAELGMTRTRFVDSTGLDPRNVASAKDLVTLLLAAAEYPLIQEYTTRASYTARFQSPYYSLPFVNTNVLVRRGTWDIGLSKTGFIREAGRCLVMLTEVEERPVAMVMLDSYGKWTPVGDAGRIKRWIRTGEAGEIAGAALRYEQARTSVAMSVAEG